MSSVPPKVALTESSWMEKTTSSVRKPSAKWQTTCEICMKIGDKIRRVLADNPKIQQRRAQLRAIYYLSKHDKTILPEWNTNSESNMGLTIWTMTEDGDYKRDFKLMWFNPLCDYKLEIE